MKAKGLVLVFGMTVVGMLAAGAGCDLGSERHARLQAIEAELAAHRQQMAELKAQMAAERHTLSRAVSIIQSRVEDLDRTLSRASSEIWGDGSSTGAHLSTAQRTLTSLQAEVDALAKQLHAPQQAH